ncbi:TPA: hypothetical protein HA231_02170 [Candidatus Woesearchaeota archaeon]|nr:hypothetical protein [Candidatus Woesearchaeota archaeon]
MYAPKLKYIGSDVLFKSGKDVKRGDSVTLLTLHPSSRKQEYNVSEEPLLFSEISKQGSILFSNNGRIVTGVGAKRGYSGSPLYNDGSVVGLLTNGNISGRPSIFTKIDKLAPLLASERASLEACLANASRN